jgi:hypothetical protein
MHDPAIAIRDHLISSGITFGVHVGAFPATIDEAVLVTLSGGRPPYPHLAINFPSLQIMVRSRPSGYEAATEVMRIICNTLLGLTDTTLATDTYRSCNQLGDVIYIGRDDRERHLFSANFWFIVLPSDTGNRLPIT